MHNFIRVLYQESEAGAWGDRVGEDGKRYGKGVRYDENGHMIKGWDEVDGDKYYFDLETGAMVKGTVEIDGIECTFDKETGVYQKPAAEKKGYEPGDTVDGMTSDGKRLTLTYIGNDRWSGTDGSSWYSYLDSSGRLRWWSGIRG